MKRIPLDLQRRQPQLIVT